MLNMLTSEQAAKSNLIPITINGEADALDEWTLRQLEAKAYRLGVTVDECLSLLINAKRTRSNETKPQPTTRTILINGEPVEFDTWDLTLLEATAYREQTTFEAVLNKMLTEVLEAPDCIERISAAIDAENQATAIH